MALAKLNFTLWFSHGAVAPDAGATSANGTQKAATEIATWRHCAGSAPGGQARKTKCEI